MDLPYDPARGRVRQRHLARRLVAVYRQHRGVGASERGPGAGHRLSPGRDADRRLLRRPPTRRQPVLEQHRCGRPQYGRATLVFPDLSPRRLGLGPAERPSPCGHHRRRSADQGGGPADKARVGVRLRPGDWRTGLADRGTAGRLVGRARRAVVTDPAVSQQASGTRPAGVRPGRCDRFHARAQSRGSADRLAIPYRADLHAAGPSPTRTGRTER